MQPEFNIVKYVDHAFGIIRIVIYFSVTFRKYVAVEKHLDITVQS